MGFGDFAMGYLLGQSFSGPTYTGEIMGKPAGPDYDILNSDDPELVAVGEKAYWEAWDKAYKKALIDGIRAGTKRLLVFRGELLYPHISSEKEASLLENNDIKIIDLRDLNIRGFFWVDNERIETKNKGYIELQELLQKDMARSKDYRII